MKRKIFLMAALILASMQMVFAQDNLEWLPATGAKNMGFKHKISYGDYQTSRVKVVEEKSSQSLLGVTIKEEHKMHYKFEQMVGEASAKVEVCENELPEGAHELNKIFNLHLGDSLALVATIKLPDNTVWTFASDVSRRNQDFNCGSIVGSDGKAAYTIFGNNHSTPKDVMLHRYISYYEVREGDKVVGRVDTQEDGKAWVDPTLDTNAKLLVSTALTCYLLRKW